MDTISTADKPRIRWTAYVPSGMPNRPESKPTGGQLCRWIVRDLFEGIIEFETVATAGGVPASEWSEQMILAYRVITP